MHFHFFITKSNTTRVLLISTLPNKTYRLRSLSNTDANDWILSSKTHINEEFFSLQQQLNTSLLMLCPSWLKINNQPTNQPPPLPPLCNLHSMYCNTKHKFIQYNGRNKAHEQKYACIHKPHTYTHAHTQRHRHRHLQNKWCVAACSSCQF